MVIHIQNAFNNYWYGTSIQPYQSLDTVYMKRIIWKVRIFNSKNEFTR